MGNPHMDMCDVMYPYKAFFFFLSFPFPAQNHTDCHELKLHFRCLMHGMAWQ